MCGLLGVASKLANTQQSIHDVQHVVLSRHSIQTKKREKLSFLSLVPYDILFSNEFLRDLGRLWSLRDIVPDPNNLPWIEKDDK